MSTTVAVRPGQATSGRKGWARWWSRPRVLVAAAGTAVLLGTVLRFWQLGVSPAWQWDETVYWRVASDVQHGQLAEHQVVGVPWKPFLYQPPFYMLLLARWFDLVGASIYHARIFGVLLTAVMLTLLLALLRKLHGPKIAVFAAIPVIFDSWLLYIERVSYIENALLVIIMIALVLYQRALEKPSWLRFAAAGAAVGAAAIFKQTGVYLVLAVLICWTIVRRHRTEHVVLLAVATSIIAAYVAVMSWLYDPLGRDWFLAQSLVQIRRVLGLQHSGGTLSSISAVLHLLTSQYRYFMPSAIVALWAFILVARRLLQCCRARSWQPARQNPVFLSWTIAGILVFGLSSLKFPQYFALVLIPAYCFAWTEFARCSWRPARKAALAGAAALAGVGCFLLTIHVYSSNTLEAVQQYAQSAIPARDVIVTEQNVGDLIDQPWCPVEYAFHCERSASYVITWNTYLESSFRQGDAAFRRLMRETIEVKSFSGPVGTATVWRIGR